LGDALPPAGAPRWAVVRVAPGGQSPGEQDAAGGLGRVAHLTLCELEGAGQLVGQPFQRLRLAPLALELLPPDPLPQHERRGREVELEGRVTGAGPPPG